MTTQRTKNAVIPQKDIHLKNPYSFVGKTFIFNSLVNLERESCAMYAEGVKKREWSLFLDYFTTSLILNDTQFS